MTTAVLSNQKNSKLQAPITALAVISLIITLVGGIVSCAHSDFIFLFNTVSPLLLVLYCIKYKDKAKLFLIIASAAICVMTCYSTVINIATFPGDGYFRLIMINQVINNIGTIFFYVAVILYANSSSKQGQDKASTQGLIRTLAVIALIFKTVYVFLPLLSAEATNIDSVASNCVLSLHVLICPLSFALYVFKAVKNSNSLLFTVSAVYTAVSLLSALTYFTLFCNNYNSYYLAYIIGDFGAALLYVTLMLIAIKAKKDAVPTKELTPEEELKLLMEKLEQGIITAEEYRARRAEIISKL